jgi:hypothetical protein
VAEANLFAARLRQSGFPEAALLTLTGLYFGLGLAKAWERDSRCRAVLGVNKKGTLLPRSRHPYATSSNAIVTAASALLKLSWLYQRDRVRGQEPTLDQVV